MLYTGCEPDSNTLPPRLSLLPSLPFSLTVTFIVSLTLPIFLYPHPLSVSSPPLLPPLSLLSSSSPLLSPSPYPSPSPSHSPSPYPPPPLPLPSPSHQLLVYLSFSVLSVKVWNLMEQ